MKVHTWLSFISADPQTAACTSELFVLCPESTDGIEQETLKPSLISEPVSSDESNTLSEIESPIYDSTDESEWGLSTTALYTVCPVVLSRDPWTRDSVLSCFSKSR